MRIMIITQTLDTKNYILAPFLRWFETIAKRADACHTVCLYKGEYTPPAEMQTYSLGKEDGVGRCTYLLRLYRYAYQLLWKRKIDVLFVHMNEIYIILLWPIAAVRGIPIVWWKAHGHLGPISRFARFFVTAVVTSSESGFKSSVKNKHILGQGIDTDIFSLRDTWSDTVQELLWVGRIAPIKKIDVLINALGQLPKEMRATLTCRIVGDIAKASHQSYLDELKRLVDTYQLGDVVRFEGAVVNTELPDWYKRADVYINTSNTQSLDKTVLEAMSSGTPVINSNSGYTDILAPFAGAQFEDGNSAALRESMLVLLDQSKEERMQTGKALRDIVVRDHNVDRLIEKLLTVFEDVQK